MFWNVILPAVNLAPSYVAKETLSTLIAGTDYDLNFLQIMTGSFFVSFASYIYFTSI